MNFYYGDNTDSLALLSAEYRAAGGEGQAEDVELASDEIPESLLVANQEPATIKAYRKAWEKVASDMDADIYRYALAQRYIGREIARETKQYDERELRRAYNRKGD